MCGKIHTRSLEIQRNMHCYHLNRRYVDLRSEFYDCMIVHRNRFHVNKTKRCTEFQYYWY